MAHHRIKEKGFSMVEMLVYVSILVFMLGVIMNVTVSIVQSERLVRASRNVENSASIALERMVRELRQADSINMSSSLFDQDPGLLVLQSTDASGNARVVEFHISGLVLMLREDGAEARPLTQAEARVTSLVFTPFSGPNSEGVRIEMSVESGEGEDYRSDNFYAAAVLR